MRPCWSNSLFSISPTDRAGLSGSGVKPTIPPAHCVRLAGGWAELSLKPGVKRPCMVTFCRRANEPV